MCNRTHRFLFLEECVYMPHVSRESVLYITDARRRIRDNLKTAKANGGSQPTAETFRRPSSARDTNSAIQTTARIQQQQQRSGKHHGL